MPVLGAEASQPTLPKLDLSRGGHGCFFDTVRVGGKTVTCTLEGPPRPYPRQFLQLGRQRRLIEAFADIYIT